MLTRLERELLELLIASYGLASELWVNCGLDVQTWYYIC
jgi:hypothetical protein